MECGGCTLCCKLLETHDMPSKLGEWCQHCDPRAGCGVYTVRPDECREYQCSWSQMEHVGEEVRPDKIHIIFDRVSDRTMCGLQDPDYELKDLAKQQIASFLKEGLSVVVIRKEIKSVYVAEGHTMAEVRKETNDRSKLHRRSE